MYFHAIIDWTPVNLYCHFPVIIVRMNGHRILRIIGELKIDAVPRYGRIRADINIGARPGMRIALVNLKISFHYTMEKRTVRLADTAAEFNAHCSVKDSACFLVAFLCRTFSDIFVEIECLTGLKNQSVYSFT